MDTLVLGHRVWHDTGGGCHSSSAPSGLVALSREHRRWGNLLTTYCKMTWQKCPVEKSVDWMYLSNCVISTVFASIIRCCVSSGTDFLSTTTSSTNPHSTNTSD